MDKEQLDTQCKVTQFKIILVNLNDLKPYPKNSRLHSEEQIQQVVDSINEFGFTNPVLIDENKTIIAGHCRVEALKVLGASAAPCIVLKGLSETQKRAYIIADNKLALNADWNLELLQSEFESLKLEDYDLNLTGFSDDEIALIIIDPEPETFADEDSCPDIPEDPITKLGDVWLLGDHRLMCGNSTIIEDVCLLMNGVKADILITDPPYNVDYEGKTKDALKIKNDSMDDSTFRQFLRDAMSTANIHLKDGGVFYIWHADSEGYNFRGACQDVGWKVRQCLIWLKNHMVMGRQDYHWKHEPCLYGWKEGAAHCWENDRKQTTIIECNRPSRNDIHPTMKPIELIEYQILNNTKPHEIILDLFGGSGSTLIASEKNNRICYIMEIDPKYCDVICKRYEKIFNKKAILESTGEPFDDRKASLN